MDNKKEVFNEEKKTQLPENDVSPRLKVFLALAIPCEIAVCVLGVFHPGIQERYDTLCIAIAIAVLECLSKIGDVAFNMPRKSFVRVLLCIPLVFILILTVFLGVKQDVAQKMRDSIVRSTNSLAKQIDRLQKFSVRNAELSEQDEADFAYELCSYFHSVGYTNEIVIAVNMNGDMFFHLLTDGLDSVLAWIPKYQVALAFSSWYYGDGSYLLDLLYEPPLPGSEFGDWRETSSQEIRFANQSKLGIIAQTLLWDFKLFGINADFVINAQNNGLTFTLKDSGRRFDLNAEDIDSFIGTDSYTILTKMVPSCLKKNALVDVVDFSGLLNNFQSFRFLYVFDDGIVTQFDRKACSKLRAEDVSGRLKALMDEYKKTISNL